jgi:NADH:ubiquinone oxidoreductase subunit 2 (subunit N)
MLFKIAAVPFHFWAPDVYEGSPALTTATMSTLAKVVAMATFYKLLVKYPTLKLKMQTHQGVATFILYFTFKIIV